MSHAEWLQQQIAALPPGVYRWAGDDGVDALVEASSSTRRTTIAVNAGAHKSELFDAFANAYGFPSDSGRNWDALYDLLSDFAAGSTLVLDVRELFRASPHSWQKLRDILVDTSDWFNDPMSAYRQQLGDEAGAFTALVVGAPKGDLTAVSPE